MAQDSKAKRKLRRLKRAENLTHRMLDLAISQRDEARAMVNYLINEKATPTNESANVQNGEILEAKSE